jgi:hypothetical protein
MPNVQFFRVDVSDCKTGKFQDDAFPRLRKGHVKKPIAGQLTLTSIAGKRHFIRRKLFFAQSWVEPKAALPVIYCAGQAAGF